MSVSARPAIGVKDVVYAVLTESSDVAGGTPTYGTVKALAGVGRLSVNPNPSVSRLAGDDMMLHVAESIGKIDFELELADIDPASEAEVLGHTYANGAIVEHKDDSSPYVAVGFKVTRTGASVSTYYWLYKGKISKPDLAAETKGESINFQRKMLKGEFQPLQANGNWRMKLRTDDPAAPAALVSGFFSTVVLTSSADLTAFTLESAAGDASDKQITLTFGKATAVAVANASALNIQVVLDSSHAILTPTSYTASAAGTSPTVILAFSSLTAAAHTIVVNAGLKDTAGVSVTPKSLAVTPSA
jgi:phi13 family phage major tail protein